MGFRREIGHNNICTGQDSKFSSVLLDCTKSGGGRKKNLWEHQAEKSQHKQGQLQGAGRFLGKYGIPVRDKRPDPYHMRIQLFDKQHVIGQIFHALERRTYHKTSAYLISDGLQVPQTGLPG